MFGDVGGCLAAMDGVCAHAVAVQCLSICQVHVCCWWWCLVTQLVCCQQLVCGRDRAGVPAEVGNKGLQSVLCWVSPAAFNLLVLLYTLALSICQSVRRVFMPCVHCLAYCGQKVLFTNRDARILECWKAAAGGQSFSASLVQAALAYSDI